MTKINDAETRNGSFGTGWSNEPQLSDLKTDFQSAKPNHDTQMTKITEWLKNLNVSSGKESGTDPNSTNPFGSSKKKVKQNRSNLRPKLIRKQAEWRYTSLSEPFLNTPDVFNVDPVTFEDMKGAKQNELVLNNQINTKMNKVEFIDEYVRTCVNEGTVIVRVGWAYESEMIEKEYPEYTLEPIKPDDISTQNLFMEAMQSQPASLPDELVAAIDLYNNTKIPHWPVQTGVEVRKEEVVTKNHPTWEVCETDNVIIDPSCNGDMDKANFVIYSFETSLSELEKTGLYSNLDKIQVEQTSVLGEPDHDSDYAESGFTFKDQPRMKFVVFEYWGYWDIDGSGETKPIVATWVGDTLIRLEENPYPDKKIPFVAVPYLPVKKSVYGEPDGELLIDNQNVLGAVQRGMIDVLGKSANSQIGIRKDALDVVNRRKFELGMDYEFNPNVDPRTAVINHVYPELPRSAFEMIMLQNNEAESLSGIKAFNDGITGAGLGETAAAANGALGAAARRELGILRRLAEGMKKIGRKMIAMNQAFLEEEEVVRVTNKRFEIVRKDDLQGLYDLRLSISTAEADEQKAQELAFMLQTTGQQFGIGMYKLILAEIAELRKMPELAHKIEQYEPEPDPMAQEMQKQEILKAQLENAKIEAEIAKIYAEAGNRQADSVKKQSETDKLNLDYVEQESGVTQERELEKQKGQARGNMELELLKNSLEPNT